MCQLMTLVLFQKKVFFALRKSGEHSKFSGRINFDTTADVLEGITEMTSSTFIAPLDGAYGFTFSGTTGDEKSATRVQVYKDGIKHHQIYEGNATDTLNNINTSWMMRLTKGQKVHLEVVDGSLYIRDYMPVIFTGNLVSIPI